MKHLTLTTYVCCLQGEEIKKGLPFPGTIVQREFTHIAYGLLFSRRSDCDKHTC